MGYTRVRNSAVSRSHSVQNDVDLQSNSLPNAATYSYVPLNVFLYCSSTKNGEWMVLLRIVKMGATRELGDMNSFATSNNEGVH